MPTEPYGCDSNSQDDVVTTGGKFIISRSEKVEISLECQCNNSLPEVTKACTETATPINPVEKPSDGSSHGKSEEKHNIPDKTSERDLPKELPDDTDQNKVVLPDETLSEISVLPDITDPIVTPDLPLLKVDSSSSDAYPDTTSSSWALPETMDTTSGVVSTESVADTTSNLDNNPNTLDQTTTDELLGATGEVLPDETETASPKHTLPDTTTQDSLPINESNNTDVNVTPSDMNVQEPVSELAQLPLDPLETTETTNDIKNESESNLSESEGTKEKIVDEVTFTDLENTNSDSKGNLTLDDMPLGISGMHPLETSSMISDPMNRGVPESTTTTSTTSNNLPDQNTKETKHTAKKV